MPKQHNAHERSLGTQNMARQVHGEGRKNKPKKCQWSRTYCHPRPNNKMYTQAQKPNSLLQKEAKMFPNSEDTRDEGLSRPVKQMKTVDSQRKKVK
jgi:hypothetical protein